MQGERQGVLEPLVKMLSDENAEKQQHTSNLLISFAENCELIIIWNNRTLTICEVDARTEMLKQGVMETLEQMLSDNITEKQVCASNLLTSLVKHGELIAL
jgi:hypothetical protein